VATVNKRVHLSHLVKEAQEKLIKALVPVVSMKELQQKEELVRRITH
jgi:hypothetical protein